MENYEISLLILAGIATAAIMTALVMTMVLYTKAVQKDYTAPGMKAIFVCLAIAGASVITQLMWIITLLQTN